ncbi:MAG: 2-aminobenzoate-CoA ligase, partial [Burkholderiales bacterium PBB5]
MATAHVDTFARDHLPPPAQWPELRFDLPELQFGPQLNCATALLDAPVAAGQGTRPCIRAEGLLWTYAELQAQANRIARVLVHDMGLQPGNRVLLRAPNTPMLAACWFAVMKAGGIAVATMPLLRAKELRGIVDKAAISHALCDVRLADELQQVLADDTPLRQVRWFGDAVAADSPLQPRRLEPAMAGHSPQFDNVDTAADDTCLLAFTSGTTGVPKATMHFHRDVMAACACWPRHVLRPTADDVFIGSPPLAFTFGLGGLLLFPMSVGASTVLLDKASPQQLVDGIARHGATVLFTAPTSYRAMAARGAELRGGTLRRCVSAGEVLPAATRTLWREATGIELIDGIGAT